MSNTDNGKTENGRKQPTEYQRISKGDGIVIQGTIPQPSRYGGRYMQPKGLIHNADYESFGYGVAVETNQGAKIWLSSEVVEELIKNFAERYPSAMVWGQVAVIRRGTSKP